MDKAAFLYLRFKFDGYTIIVMISKILWWIIEVIVWYFFFYLILFACRNTVNIGWTAFFLVIIGSFGVFANPLTRHLSIWNKVIDRIVKKEEEQEKY